VPVITPGLGAAVGAAAGCEVAAATIGCGVFVAGTLTVALLPHAVSNKARMIVKTNGAVCFIVGFLFRMILIANKTTASGATRSVVNLGGFAAD
jgi:hypothetical protein